MPKRESAKIHLFGVELTPMQRESNPTKEDIEIGSNKTFPSVQGESTSKRGRCYNQKIDSCRGFCRTVRRVIYPHIDFNLYHNNRYKERDYLDTLTHMAMNQDFTNNGSQTFALQRGKSPSGHNLLYHVGGLSRSEIMEMFDRVFETIHKMGRSKNVFYRTMDVAIDLTDWPYYGDKNDPMIVGAMFQRGTKYAYRFATIAIVVDGRRFTLLTLPVSQFESKAKIVEELIAYAKKKVHIRIVYLDRGFNSVDVINTIERLGVKYLIPMSMRGTKVKRLVDESEPNKVLDYTMKSTHRTKKQYKTEASFKFCIVKSTKTPDKKVVFATNLNVDERNVETMCNRYGKRWGIETSYRVQDNLMPKTTSKNYAVRLFYFLFSVCLYNLWVLANIFVGLLILGRVPEKPVISAKIFGTMLYTTFLIDPGG